MHSCILFRYIDYMNIVTVTLITPEYPDTWGGLLFFTSVSIVPPKKFHQ